MIKIRKDQKATLPLHWVLRHEESKGNESANELPQEATEDAQPILAPAETILILVISRKSENSEL